MRTIPVDSRGWARLPATLKAHYFPGDNAPSLCGRWAPSNADPEGFHDGDHRSQDNCAACRLRRERLTPN